MRTPPAHVAPPDRARKRRRITRLTLAGLPDRLAEHPDTVVVLTNMFYAEAPSLYPRSPANQARVQWWDVPLDGDFA